MKYSSGFWQRLQGLRLNGTAPIYLRITIDRKSRMYHTGQYVKPDDWAGTSVKNKHPLCIKLNTLLNGIKLNADDILIDMNKDGKVNFESFEQRYLNTQEQKRDFYEFSLDLINRNKERYSQSFHYHFSCEISKIKKFAPTLTFSEITLDFIERYEQYMRGELKNKTNTVARTMKRLKYLTGQAILKNHIKTDPFAGYKITKEPTNREYISMEQVRKLEEKLPELQPGMQHTLTAFLFCCYTGLRYQDVYDLTFDEIRDGALRIKMHKTHDDVSIPLNEQARKFIPEASSNGKVFTVYTNQKCNLHLKAIAVIAGIKTNLTFHVARHTFATISLNLGIPMEVVSKLLGHTDMKTTQIYAKLMDKTKFEQMEKWKNA